jgi:hypothetical protein
VAGGLQSNFGQGTLTADSPESAALTGEAASGGVGSYTKETRVRLFSRRVGGGTASQPLTGAALAIAYGLVEQAPSAAPTSQLAALLGGTLGRERDKALTSASATIAAGTLTPAGAADPNFRYVTQTARGTGSGVDWSNSMAFPSSFTRGLTYYVADGSYGSRTLSTATSGTQTITIKKATTADHGTNVGWINGDGDGQAIFGGITLGSDYWVIDGTTRNEADWDQGTAYGFRIGGIIASTALTPGVCASNCTFRYLDVGGPESSSYTGSEDEYCFKIAGFDELATNWTISRCYAHNIAHAAQFHMNGWDGGTIEYCWISNGWGKEAIRGQIAFKNITVRHNVFWNASRNSGEPGEGSTAEIAAWDGGANAFDNNKIYGNVFFRNTSDQNSGGTIVVGGNGSSWAGSPANNTLVYNNTIAGVEGGGVGGLILVNGGTGNVVRNNLWYDAVGGSASANTTSNNVTAASDPFVGYSTGNLHLTSAGAAALAAGTALASPYNTDMDGVTRGADGKWDVGAFEYQA